MKSKTILLLTVFFISSFLATAQEVKDKTKKNIREVELTEKVSLKGLMGLKEGQELVSYKISMVNRAEGEVFIWDKGEFDEARIVKILQEKKTSSSMLYIENIVVKMPDSDKTTKYAPLKMKIK